MTVSLVLYAVLCLPLLAVLLLLRSLLRSQSAVQRFPSSSASSSARRVVVVGGSFAGLTFCRELLHHLPLRPPPSDGSAAAAVEVTLVEPRQWFEYTPGVLRAVVRPAHHPSLLTPIRHTSAGGDERLEHVQGVCAALTDHAALVALSNGEERWVQFDYCVLALGSGYSEHIKQRDTAAAQRHIAATPTQRQQHQQPHEDEITAAAGAADSQERFKAAVPVLAASIDSAHSTARPDASSAPTIAQRLSALSSVHAALQNSHDVLVVGAGLVGVVTARLHTRASAACTAGRHRTGCMLTGRAAVAD